MPPFAIAFQPILDVDTGLTIAQEALVRGPGGESAASVLGAVGEAGRYALDAAIRARAVADAARLGLAATNASLTLNIYPGCLRDAAHGPAHTVAAARAAGFPPGRLVFEISETEPVDDPEALAWVLAGLQRAGLRIALDDVGTGHARRPLLLAWRPDGVKLAREVILGLDRDRDVHERVRAMLADLAVFGLAPVVEGVETPGEMRALRALGVRAMQGFLFARPAVGRLPVPVLPPPGAG